MRQPERVRAARRCEFSPLQLFRIVPCNVTMCYTIKRLATIRLMTREQAIKVAKASALNASAHHGYLPAVAHDWMPDEWVIEAICTGAAPAVREVERLRSLAKTFYANLETGVMDSATA